VVSTFQYTDCDWVKHHFSLQSRGDSAAYADSWLYVTQATRCRDGTLGRYLRYPDFFTGIATHREHCVLVHPTGLPPAEFIPDLRALIYGKGMDELVYVKKARASFLHRLMEAGVRITTAESHPWSETAAHDDDTFPERVIDVDQALSLPRRTGRNSARIRSKLRHGMRHTRWMTIRSINTQDRIALVGMLKTHFHGHTEKINAYRNMIESLITLNDSRLGSLVASIDGSVVAFFAYELLDSQSAGLYASVALRQYTGLSEYMMFRALHELATRNIKFINVGGSESSGLDSYKMKFLPVRSVANHVSLVTLSDVVDVRPPPISQSDPTLGDTPQLSK
jgi:hypothetical protein